MKLSGDFLAHEVKYVTQTIEKIMSEWSKNGKKNFTVKVPDSHKVKEFELLLKQMLNHYQVPVRTSVQEISIEIKCGCGYVCVCFYFCCCVLRFFLCFTEEYIR